MTRIVDVLYKADGSIIALGFSPSASESDVQAESGPMAQPDQLVGQFELPAGIVTGRHADLSRLVVDVAAMPHRLALK